MEKILFLMAIVIFLCVAFQKLLGKTGVPGLFIFILLGMLFGSDGLFKVEFDNYSFANQICSIALIFIMFYGGAGTKWSTAKPTALKALCLSSLGTVLTAGLVGAFCFWGLGFPIVEAFLLGSVISSTDAASVFSILRSKKMNLKYGTAPLLEVESGSNDPFSYMLTVVFLSLMDGGSYSAGEIILLLLKQVAIGGICGLGFAYIAGFLLRRFDISDLGIDTTFFVGIALISYTVPFMLGGNGYLSVYIAGIILGNIVIPNKESIIDFLGGLTTLMQMLLFFLLGLLSSPSELPHVAKEGLAIALFLTFAARPLAIFGILGAFKCCLKQQIFVAWSGMRGAASIVFAIMAMTGTGALVHDVFHIVFFIVLFSILVQGTLLPSAAGFLNMIDTHGDVMKTFNDYTEKIPVNFLQFTLQEGHSWQGRTVSDIVLPPESLLVLILRGKERLVPQGDTVLKVGDTLVLGGREGGEINGIHLYEESLGEGHRLIGRRLSEQTLSAALVILILRNNKVIIPDGSTVLQQDDILVMSNR